MKHIFGDEIDTAIFYFVAVLTIPFIILGAFWPEGLAKVSNVTVGYVCRIFQSTILLSVTGFLVFSIAIAISPFGKIKLGRESDKPEFSRFSWFCMLFASGMGIGLIFWSVAEPMIHMTTPPTGNTSTLESARLGMEIYFFHWGFHAWAIYAIVGLTMAYFQFRKGEAALVSRCLIPIIGKKNAEGLIGRIVDALTIWATIFGMVTGFGIGGMQLAGGISQFFEVAGGHTTTAIVIGIITIVFIISVISGLSKGINYVSQMNIYLMIALLCYFIVFGPTLPIVKTLGTAFFDYLMDLPEWSLKTVLFENVDWTRSWTVWYWTFWIAWAPFVGLFIARISRGRTIREFLLGVILLPPLFSFIFSTALGGTAIYLDITESAGIREIIKKDVAMALFETMKYLPAYHFIAGVAMLLISIFQITSCASATYVVTRFATRGQEPSNKMTNNRLTIACGMVIGGLTIVFDISGGLKGLQSATIVGGIPFMLIMFLCIVSLMIDLSKSKQDVAVMSYKKRQDSEDIL